ncbi:MAG: hypothetical protein HY914_04525 [Desulfomonile tiedjei]|nr:hypothetical protein [Desulfomonile tiedjei]
MHSNGFRTRSDAELTHYQKKVQAIDNVILCVSEAERMINSIGDDLIADLPEIKKSRRRRSPHQKEPWADRRNLFKR